MNPVWQIDGSDIIQIQGRSSDFVRVVNRLLAQQVQGILPNGAVRLNVKDTEPDGGVDATVDRPVPGDPTGLLGVPTCWQYKAQPKGNVKSRYGGGQEAALREEIGKDYSQELIKNGYAYRFCIADDMPPEKKAEWEGWLTDEARKTNATAPAAMVVTATDLANWVNRFPAIVGGEFRPFVGGMISLVEWHREFQSITPEFVLTTASPATVKAILQHVDFTKQIPRILTVQGEAGVGKSRAVCEALRGNAARDALVAVTKDEQHALAFAQVIAKNSQTRAILVADECSVDVRVRLHRIAESCSERLRVIAIDNSLQREGSAEEIRLDHFERDEVASILDKNFPGLPADRRRAYADLAKGFVRLAVDLCQYDYLVPPNGRIDSVFGFFHDTYLQSRLRPDELHAVELVSLLPRVGYRDDVKFELETLCALPLVGMHADDVVKAAHKLKQSPGFIAFAGRFLYVTPTLIGQVAFQGAWDRWIAPDPSGFLKALPESFIAPFVRQAQGAGTEAMRTTVSDFFLDWVTTLDPPALGSEATVLRLVRLVEVQSGFTLPQLRSLLERASLDELQRLHSDTLDGQQARRQLVWLAEKLAHFPESFADAEAMLFRLAAAETEKHLGNSASRIWAALFRVVLSGTPVPFAERLTLLERRLQAASPTTLPLVLDAFDEILMDGLVSRLASPPILFGRIPPPQWRPADQAERHECREAALAMAARVATTQAAVAEGIRGAVVRRLSSLLLAGFLDEVQSIVGPPPLPDSLLIEVVEGVDDFLDVFCRDNDIPVHRPLGTNGSTGTETNSGSRRLNRTASVDLEARVRAWRRSLVPGDIHSRLVTLVGQEYWHQELDGDHQAWECALDELADELLRSSAFLQRELPWLSSPNARSAYRFGQALARVDAGAKLLDQMLWEVPRAGGTVLARGYLEHVAASRPNLLPRINEQLDRLQEENPKAAFDVIWSSGDEVRKVERLFDMVDRGGIGAEFLRGLEYGIRDRQLREQELLGAVERLLLAAQQGNERAASAVVNLLYSWLRPNRRESAVNRLRAHGMVLDVLPKVLEATIADVGREPSFWIELAADLAAFRPEDGTRLLAMALVSGNYNTRSLAEASLVGFAKIAPSAVMDAVDAVTSSPLVGWAFRVDDFSQLLAALPMGVVQAWLERVGKRGAMAIARHLLPPALSQQGEPVVAPLTEFVLSRFEEEDEVFDEFVAGTHSGQVYSGDIATQYDDEAETARRFLGHPLRRVREWAEAELQSAKHDSQYWRQRDEEIAAPS